MAAEKLWTDEDAYRFRPFGCARPPPTQSPPQMSCKGHRRRTEETRSPSSSLRIPASHRVTLSLPTLYRGTCGIEVSPREDRKGREAATRPPPRA